VSESDADSHLLEIARAIVDGAKVDWARERSASETDALSGLRALETLVRAHRNLARDLAETVEPGTMWGHLRIVTKVDEGSFGAVYRAHDDRLGTDVALKLLWPRDSHDAGYAARVLNEARLLAKMRHPNVVHVYGVEDRLTPVGLWMEFVKGNTLADLLDQSGPFAAREAALIGVDICHALAAAHHAGLVHGDIKARNVMRETGGRIVVMDFGSGGNVDARGTTTAIEGTPVYAAPEVLTGHERTERSDIYSLGVLLFHLVTGEYPVPGRTTSQVVDGHRRQTKRLLRDVRADLPDAFVRIVERATAHEPADRYESAGALESELAAVVHARGETSQKNRRLLFAAGVMIVLLTIASAFLWRLASRGTMASSNSAPSIATHVPASRYSVQATFFKVTQSGEQPLTNGSSIAPGDRLKLAYRATLPTYLYVVDEPDEGKPFLLFPMSQQKQQMLPANEQQTIPEGFFWQVTTLGKREHFLVFASPDPVDAFDEAFGQLATPRVGEPITSASLSPAVAERLRGVGGLVPAEPSSPGARFSALFTTPLGGEETATGIWARQLTVENAGGKRTR